MASGGAVCKQKELRSAATNGDATAAADLIAWLRQHEASLDVQDDSGRTALHHAAARGHEACVSALLAAGASVHVADAQGMTPLIAAAAIAPAAASSPLAAVLQALLQSGANPVAEDINHHTMLSYLAHRGMVQPVRFMIERQRQQGQPFSLQQVQRAYSVASTADVLNELESHTQQPQQAQLEQGGAAAAPAGGAVVAAPAAPELVAPAAGAVAPAAGAEGAAAPDLAAPAASAAAPTAGARDASSRAAAEQRAQQRQARQAEKQARLHAEKQSAREERAAKSSQRREQRRRTAEQRESSVDAELKSKRDEEREQAKERSRQTAIAAAAEDYESHVSTVRQQEQQTQPRRGAAKQPTGKATSARRRAAGTEPTAASASSSSRGSSWHSCAASLPAEAGSSAAAPLGAGSGDGHSDSSSGGSATVAVAASREAAEPEDTSCSVGALCMCIWRSLSFEQQEGVRDAILADPELRRVQALLQQCDALLAAQGSAAACPSLGAALLLPEERASLQAYLGAAPGSDAAEVLLCVLEKLEPTLGSSIAAASPGIVSAAFGLKESQEVRCPSCGKHTRCQTDTYLFHATEARQLCTAPSACSSLGAALAEVAARTASSCDPDLGGCGRSSPLCRVLQHAPKVFTLKVNWELQDGTAADIAMAAIHEMVDLSEMYDETPRGVHHYQLCAMVGSTHGQQVLVELPAAGGWCRLDRTGTARVGDWCAVRRLCGAEGIRPSLLFFEATAAPRG